MYRTLIDYGKQKYEKEPTQPPYQSSWIIINRRLPELWDVTGQQKRQIKIGEYVELTEGRKILLSSSDGGRLMVVQLVNN